MESELRQFLAAYDYPYEFGQEYETGAILYNTLIQTDRQAEIPSNIMKLYAAALMNAVYAEDTYYTEMASVPNDGIDTYYTEMASVPKDGIDTYYTEMASVPKDVDTYYTEMASVPKVVDTYYTEIYPMDSVPKDVIDTIRSDYKLTIEEESDANGIYGEQLMYLRAKNKNAYYVAAFQSPRIYIGGVALFLDTVGKDPNNVIIDTPAPGFQGIAKSIDGLKVPVKLNSLLLPAVVNFLRPLGYHAVYVAPVGKQRQILLTHYGFERYNPPPTPEEIEMSQRYDYTFQKYRGVLVLQF